METLFCGYIGKIQVVNELRKRSYIMLSVWEGKNQTLYHVCGKERGGYI